MKIPILVLSIVFSIISADLSGQNSLDYFKKHIIEIKNRTIANSDVYNTIKDYSAILIGEMHGTIEPTEFVLGIAKTLIVEGNKVIVGLEIPEDEYNDIIEGQNIDELKNTDYFKNAYKDGRQTIAFAEMILSLKKLKNVKLFFMM